MFASVKPTTPGSADWWRDRYRLASTGRRRGRADGLNLTAISDVTMRIIEQEGLDAVTMRRIADELGTGAASLYRHVAGRDELLTLVADKVFDQIRSAPVDDAVGWRERSAQTARRFRAFLLARPAIVPLLNRAQLLGPNSLQGRERALCQLIADDFPPELAVHTYLTLTHYVIGSIHVDGRSAKRNPSQRRALTALFRELDADRYPTVVALADVLGGLRPDDEFEFGLQALLDGIAAALERSR
jgi:AcrR family transcriptional regulator